MPSIHKRSQAPAPAPPNLSAQAQALDVNARQLEQRCKLLQSQADAEREKARTYMRAGNRTLARSCLQRSKMYEQQLQAASTQLTMFSSMSGNVSNIQTMQEGVRAMQGANAAIKSIDMDKLGDQMMDAAADMQDISLDMQTMSQQMEAMNEMMVPDVGADMDMLDDELRVMSQMDVPTKPLQVEAPAAAKPNPTYAEMMDKFT